MSIPKDVSAIGEADLLALIEQPVLENKSTEYKEMLNLQGDEAKKKFVASIASFANASGGDLIYGMKANDGRPVALQALLGFNADQTLLTITELVRAGIEPKVYGIGFQPVALGPGGHALVIRVPKTWAGAHMVVYNKDNRFYTRAANGRVLMDVPEIRAAFSLAEATAERIRRFRLERIGDIVADEVPVPLNGKTRLVLHLCPMVSFGPSYRCDVAAIRKQKDLLKPIAAMSWGPAVDFDGDYAYASTGTRGEYHGYTKLFHNGCIETVDSETWRAGEYNGKPERLIASGMFEQHIFGSVHASLAVLKAASVEPPLFVMLSLLGVGGYSMCVDHRWRNYSSRPIPRDNLIVPELLVESIDIEEVQVAKLMRPLFDSVWNACGWQQSINYDAEGNWKAAQ